MDGAFVTDDVLTHAISELRRVFGDDVRAPRYIQTIPKGGYRLIALLAREDVPPREGLPTEVRRSARTRAIVWALTLMLVAGAAGWVWPAGGATDSCPRDAPCDKHSRGRCAGGGSGRSARAQPVTRRYTSGVSGQLRRQGAAVPACAR